MSHLSKIFSKTPIDVPNRSGFDMSFENMLTMKVGTLTPILCEEVLPNETYSLGYLGQVQLPPMATDFFGRVDMRLEAFFVPNRVVWGGWQNFYTMPQNNPYGTPVVRPTALPSASIPVTASNLKEIQSVFGAGSLADYLGVSSLKGAISEGVTISIPNVLPFVGYHKIYDDWYRNSKIQKPVFVNRLSIDNPSSLPWSADTFSLNRNWAFNDGSHFFDLRQRNYAKDRFTTASLYPQADGTVGGSKLSLDTSGAEGSFTIAQLRQANVLQRWLERNNIAGERYADQIRATFGVYPSDAILDRSLYLGSSQFAIYNKSVYSTADADPSTAPSQSPFSGTLASKGASANGVGQDSLISKFQSTEHGYLFVLASIVPHAQYSTGVRPTFARSKVGDFANPLLQGLGEQSIKMSEFLGPFVQGDSSLYTVDFGYQQQYSEYKYHNDELHGLLRDDESLQSFALQRSFSKQVAPVLGTDFIQIKTSDMDNVTSVKSQLSQFGAWADFYISLKKVSPLSEYVIPTLGDVKNTHKESVPYRGTML